MNLRFLFFAFVLFMSNESNSQTKPYSDILPKGIKANPILDSSSYLPDSLRLTVFNFLKTKGFDLTKCFCDKEIGCNKKDNTLEIRIWDVDDLSVRKKREKLKREVEYESTHPNFYSGIIVYDIKTKTIKFYGDE